MKVIFYSNIKQKILFSSLDLVHILGKPTQVEQMSRTLPGSFFEAVENTGRKDGDFLLQKAAADLVFTNRDLPMFMKTTQKKSIIHYPLYLLSFRVVILYVLNNSLQEL